MLLMLKRRLPEAVTPGRHGILSASSQLQTLNAMLLYNGEENHDASLLMAPQAANYWSLGDRSCKCCHNKYFSTNKMGRKNLHGGTNRSLNCMY